MSNIVYKIATEDWEFEQIHRLNYATFVEEIPQHAVNQVHRLVDKFHDKNTYFTALDGDTLLGMIAFCGQRPFSLDQKLPDLDTHLDVDATYCEIRLLAVKPETRGSNVAANLIMRCVEEVIARGFDHVIISAATSQMKLYQHMGYSPFGPLVGKEEAQYQPMMIDRATYERKMRPLYQRLFRRSKEEINLSTGPVTLSSSVKEAFKQDAISHRSEAFLKLKQSAELKLKQLTKANSVVLASGSGTLANEMIAAHLKQVGTKGLIVSNGEFGQRLISIAQRHELAFESLELDCHEPFDLVDLKRMLAGKNWLWCVHGETSTGRINPLNELTTICNDMNLKLCMDCVSSIGVKPVELSGIYLASASSGKGLASVAGLALVFANQKFAPSDQTPAYIDIGTYQETEKALYTISSNLVEALDTALNEDFPKRFAHNRNLSNWFSQELKSRNLDFFEHENQHVFSIKVDKSKELGAQLATEKLRVGFESTYLAKMNLIQVALFGDTKQMGLQHFLETLNSSNVHKPN